MQQRKTQEDNMMHIDLQSVPLLLSTAHKLQQSTSTMSSKAHTLAGIMQARIPFTPIDAKGVGASTSPLFMLFKK
jgi:hypothetical protein